MLEKGVQGRIHLGGLERISRYGFAQKMVAVFHLRQSHLIPCKQADMLTAAPRPADVSLNSQQAFALGYHPLSLEEELGRLKNDF